MRTSMDEYLDAAILSLQRLQAKTAKRGRPPKVLEKLRRAEDDDKRASQRQT